MKIIQLEKENSNLWERASKESSKLRARQPEGAILDRNALKKIGYDIFILERTEKRKEQNGAKIRI